LTYFNAGVVVVGVVFVNLEFVDLAPGVKPTTAAFTTTTPVLYYYVCRTECIQGQKVLKRKWGASIHS
jgi:hypothetical protein